MTPNWQRIGLKSKDQAIKYVLASLLKNRKNIIDCGLGSAWKVGENKHEAIEELQESVFVLGGAMFYLTPRGFSPTSKVRP